MKIQESGKWYLVFYTRYGQFEYQVMFFKLANISASF